MTRAEGVLGVEVIEAGLKADGLAFERVFFEESNLAGFYALRL